MVKGNYLNRGYGPKTEATPQSEEIPGKNQVLNDAGGYSFELDEWAKLDRFLVLGSEGGTYYVSERKLTKKNTDNLIKCIKKDGKRVVKSIVDISDAGRAHKNDPALFALAACAGLGDIDTRRLAFEALPKVARTGTHLFHFASYVEQFRGWGKGLRNAVGCWYSSKSGDDLAFQVVKYQQRDGWSHDDLLRLSHPSFTDVGQQAVVRWITDGIDGFGEKAVKGKNGSGGRKYNPICVDELPKIVIGFEKAKKASSEDEVIPLIKEYGLTFEMIPTQFHTSAKIYETIIPNLGLTAIIRNLGNMSKSGYLAKGKWEAKELICSKITNQNALKKSRIHPISILAALITYSSGHGVKGKGEWEVVPDVVNALDKAFYLSFGNVESTGKRMLLGLDVSGSMCNGEISGVPGLTPAVGAAAMSMIAYKTEKQVEVMGFDQGLRKLDISKCEDLQSVVKKTSNINGGGTDCALPMIWASKNNLEFDVFVVYTDNETWFGHIHPCQALTKYRKQTGIPAKLIVVGMEANEFTIADPNDGGMMDVVGFDTATPEVMRDFIVS